LRAELDRLLNRVDRDVARTGDDAGLALEAVAAALQHVLDEVHAAVAGGLGADEAAAVREAFAGEHAGMTIRDATILAEEVADLASADTDVARGHVDVFADVAVELGHHRFAEAHHLAVRLPFRIEIGAALRAAHRQARQAVLQNLLEAEELEDRQVHR